MSHKRSAEPMDEEMARAIRHWAAPDFREGPEGAAGPPLTIAITRQAGARGAVVARALSERLGWPVYDRDLLTRISEEMGLETRLVESVDEKRVGWVRELLEGFSSRTEVNQAAYVRHLVRVLLSLASHGSCVIVGRGAAQILPAATTLRVRLVAPLRARIATMQDSLGMTHEAAETRVAEIDRERTRFVRDHFHKNADDPTLYDLVLNSSRLGVEECVELILAAAAFFARKAEVPTQKPMRLLSME